MLIYQLCFITIIFYFYKINIVNSTNLNPFAKRLKYLPNTIQELEDLILKGEDDIKVKSYEKLKHIYKTTKQREVLVSIMKVSSEMSYYYKKTTTSIKSTKNLWGFYQGYNYAKMCETELDKYPELLYQCMKWKAALLETDIFEGNLIVGKLQLDDLKNTLDKIYELKHSNNIPDDPFLLYLKGRLVCEIKLQTTGGFGFIQKGKEWFFGNVIDHKNESIDTCISYLNDFESNTRNEEGFVESKLALGKAFIEKKQLSNAIYWLKQAVDLPTRNSKSEVKNQEARELLQKTQFDFYSSPVVY
ncbi:uncharacterized protein LOC126902527 [Daktulosphaira vitifoliae]|uniref:uncharacterized protein LOC126902527 n=1 Tax=Daktulosphaira vitifoliae TaxID=58002 RepID=UPI0021AA9091|nr:uncharacterized protein LOC126902527 [Daktulosphaira vitifoliae]